MIIISLKKKILKIYKEGFVNEELKYQNLININLNEQYIEDMNTKGQYINNNLNNNKNKCEILINIIKKKNLIYINYI